MCRTPYCFGDCEDCVSEQKNENRGCYQIDEDETESPLINKIPNMIENKEIVKSKIDNYNNRLTLIKANYKQLVLEHQEYLNKPMTQAQLEIIQRSINRFIQLNGLYIHLDVHFSENTLHIVGRDLADQLIWQSIQNF